MQIDILKVFSKANNCEEFIKKIPNSIDLILDYGINLIKGEIKHTDLVFTTRISKNINEYKVDNLVKSALIEFKKSKIHIKPGQSIRYIVKNEKSHKDSERVCIINNLDENNIIDIDYYLRQIAKCGESILTPFGYKIEHINQMLQKIKNRYKIKRSRHFIK
jgi:DNA polymerase elongation subunit (family B)